MSKTTTEVMQLDRAFIKGKAEKTPEGFLVIDAVVTRPGVYLHLVDGKPHRRYFPPEVVYDKESYQTLNLKPVIAGHPYQEPGQMITPVNITAWTKGTVGENTREVDGDVMTRFTVTHPDAIEKIENKELTELSCGYTTVIDWTPGITEDGQEYDSKQISRPMYNHLSLERRGRVGGAAIPALDSGEEIHGVSIALDADKTNKTELHKMAILTIDNVQYEVSDSFVSVFRGIQSALDAKEKELSTVQAALEVEKAEKSKVQSALDSTVSKEDIDKQIIAGAKELAGVMAHAVAIGLDAKDLEDKSLDEVKQAVCLKAFPEIALDGKDNAFIDGIYSAAIQAKPAVQKDHVKTPPAGKKPAVALDARDEYIQKLKEGK